MLLQESAHMAQQLLETRPSSVVDSTPCHRVVFLDTSGSMGPLMSPMKQYFGRTLPCLPRRDNVLLATFSNEIKSFNMLDELLPYTSHQSTSTDIRAEESQQVEKAIGCSGGRTSLYDSMVNIASKVQMRIGEKQLQQQVAVTEGDKQMAPVQHPLVSMMVVTDGEDNESMRFKTLIDTLVKLREMNVTVAIHFVTIGRETTMQYTRMISAAVSEESSDKREALAQICSIDSVTEGKKIDEKLQASLANCMKRSGAPVTKKDDCLQIQLFINGERNTTPKACQQAGIDVELLRSQPLFMVAPDLLEQLAMQTFPKKDNGGFRISGNDVKRVVATILCATEFDTENESSPWKPPEERISTLQASGCSFVDTEWRSMGFVTCEQILKVLQPSMPFITKQIVNSVLYSLERDACVLSSHTGLFNKVKKGSGLPVFASVSDPRGVRATLSTLIPQPREHTRDAGVSSCKRQIEDVENEEESEESHTAKQARSLD